MEEHDAMLFLQLHQILLKQQCGDAVLTIFFIDNICAY